MDVFNPGSLQHAVTVSACMLFIAVLAWTARRLWTAAPATERRLRIGWTGFVVVFQIYNQLRWFLPENFTLRGSLPLHVCDLTVVLAPFALLTNNRTLRALVYFWGIGLSINAFLFPILPEGPARIEFWLFWIGHTQVVASAAYLVGIGFRPRFHDVLVATAAIAVYNVLITAVNVAFDLDYGYTGPDSATLADLGPWPHRLLVLWLLEFGVFVLLWLPWKLCDPHRRLQPDTL